MQTSMGSVPLAQAKQLAGSPDTRTITVCQAEYELS